MEKKIPYSVLTEYPPYNVSEVHSLFEKACSNMHPKLVVLDDDPTGIQTVHDVSVYTTWDEAAVRQGFEEPGDLFFILTNSRSFSAKKTREVHQEIAYNICSASKQTGKPFIIFSRSDSTLRGYFPLETETLKTTVEKETGIHYDGEILAPFFLEGGRYTIDDVHYVKQGNELCPAGQTEFAQDKSFSYTASNLKEWVEEKSGHTISAASVVGIELTDLRSMNIDKIEQQLLSVKDFGKVIVNAVDYTDLEIFGIAFFRAVAKGKQFMFRCAASIVKVLGNVSTIPLLMHDDLIDKTNHKGGIVLIGSHVRKTTMQMEELKKISSLEFIEFNQHLVLEDLGLEKEVVRTIGLAEKYIESGKSVVVYTRRDRLDLPENDPEKNLAVSVTISDAVTSIIAKLKVRPSFIVAKGGITSSDVGTKALKVKKARVMGQLQPGVPVWMTGPESKFPSMPYVIFPGNVGEIDTLRKVVEELNWRDEI